MSQTARFSSIGGTLLALCVTLAGCSARTDVYGTGSTPSQYTHIFITAQQIWFNTSASAGVDDSGWAKFTLSTPVTFDLVTDSNGTLAEIADDLHLTAGTYNSVLIIPVASEAGTAASATALGAAYNLEADYVDSGGTTHAVPLIVPNPEKGIVIPGATSLTVPFGSIGFGTKTSGTTSTTATGVTLTSTTSTTSTSSTTSGSSTTTRVSFATSFDGNRDLHLFTYPIGTGANVGPNTGVMLSSNPSSSNLATTGAISGTLTLTSLTNITAVSDRVAIQASAEVLSADKTHYVIVASAPVQTDGTFTIYPLPSNSSTATDYDVVIHGPNIATIIIKSVPATTSAPSTSTSSTTTNTATAGTPVSIGTFIPRQSVNSSGTSTSFTASVASNTSTYLPPGAAVVFYQTLPGSSQYPYAIDEIGLDPLNLNMTGETLSGATIDVGTYSSSGSTITVTAATPVEGQGVYKVGATAPLYNDASLSSSYQVSASSPSVTLPALTPTSGSSTVSLTATVSSSGAYDQGQLIVSHNGAVVGTASLASALKGGSVTVSGLPGGANAKYYLSAIVWNSSSPSPALAGTGTFKYESLGNPVDLSGGSVSDVTLTIE